MAVTVFGTPNNLDLNVNSISIDPNAKAIAVATAMKAAATGSLSISDVVIVGSTSGAVSYGNGEVGLVQTIATLNPDIVSYVFYVVNPALANLVGSTATATISYAGTPAHSNVVCVAYNLLTTGNIKEIVFDTSAGVATTVATFPWAENAITANAGSVQIFAYGGSTSSTGVANEGAGTPTIFTERRDVNALSHLRFAAGDYTYAAGGTRGIIANTTPTNETGSITVVSFKEYNAPAVSSAIFGPIYFSG